jgi:hypothetical protein
VNAAFSLVIILFLGGTGTLLIRWRIRTPWKIAIAGATIAMAIWVGGCYTLFFITAPEELSFPLFKPVLFTFLIALIPVALLACFADAAPAHGANGRKK